MNWNDIFEYRDGNLFRKAARKNQHKHVGWVNNSGYLQTEVNKKCYMVHRIIYEMHHGKIPPGMQIDHINVNQLDNRIENLRLATQSQNQINCGVQKNSSTKLRGVHKTPSGKYQARLGYKGKKLYLGLFDTPEEAARVCEEKRRELHGEFARA